MGTSLLKFKKNITLDSNYVQYSFISLLLLLQKKCKKNNTKKYHAWCHCPGSHLVVPLPKNMSVSYFKRKQKNSFAQHALLELLYYFCF